MSLFIDELVEENEKLKKDNEFLLGLVKILKTPIHIVFNDNERKMYMFPKEEQMLLCAEVIYEKIKELFEVLK